MHASAHVRNARGKQVRKAYDICCSPEPIDNNVVFRVLLTDEALRNRAGHSELKTNRKTCAHVDKSEQNFVDI